MSIPAFSDNSRRESEEVRQFFDQWEIYRKVVACDYLHHRGAYAAIGAILQRIERPFSLIDLGAGDASAMVSILPVCRLQKYEAVDISGVALGLAEHYGGCFGWK